MTEAGPEVVFYAEVPSTDRYHLYLDFKHEGVVRTASFTVTGASAAPEAPRPGESEGEGDLSGDDGADHGSDDGH